MAMDVSKLVDKARECVETRNYGYAIELYQQALTLSPNSVGARKELRAVEVRNCKENGISGLSAKLKGLVPLIKLILPSKDPERKMMAAEQYLRNDPGNLRVLTRLGQSAIKAGHSETSSRTSSRPIPTTPRRAGCWLRPMSRWGCSASLSTPTRGSRS